MPTWKKIRLRRFLLQLRNVGKTQLKFSVQTSLETVVATQKCSGHAKTRFGGEFRSGTSAAILVEVFNHRETVAMML